MTESNQREIDVRGHIEVSDELCEDGSEALLFITEENEAFVIRNRKVVKRLMKYAYEEDVHIKIHGLVKRSTDGIDVLGVIGYEAPKQEQDNDSPMIIPDIKPRKKKSKRHARSEDDIFVSLDENADYLESDGGIIDAEGDA